MPEETLKPTRQEEQRNSLTHLEQIKGLVLFLLRYFELYLHLLCLTLLLSRDLGVALSNRKIFNCELVLGLGLSEWLEVH